MQRLVIFCGLFVAACGGGGGASPAAPETPAPGGPVASADRRLDTDVAGAGLSIFPQICCDGPRVYVTWYDRRAGDLDVYFNRSLDGGVTWLEQDVRLDSGPAGAAGSLIPRICCAGLRVYVAWFDERNGDADVYVNRSLDGGTTWLAQDVRLDTDAPGAAQSREPVICCDEDSVYVAWFDDRSGDWDVRLNRSLDAGATWLPADVRVDHDSGSARAELPRIGCVGSAVHVVWRDERGGLGEIYANRSLDGGATWLPSDLRLGVGGPVGLPRIACAAAGVYVVWADARDGAPDIRFNRSTDDGATWLPAAVRLGGDLPGADHSADPHLCVEGQAVYVVWTDARHGSADVFFASSPDGGSTWPGGDRQISDDPASAYTAHEPRICCAQGRLHVVWRDDRDGAFDVRLTHSPDAGVAWIQPSLRLDSGPGGGAHSVAPEVCCDGASARAVWYDQRAGPGDIHTNRADFTPEP